MGRSGRSNMFQKNLASKPLKLLNSFTFIQILVAVLKVEGITGLQIESPQATKMESLTPLIY